MGIMEIANGFRTTISEMRWRLTPSAPGVGNQPAQHTDLWVPQTSSDIGNLDFPI
jgi:hypothetical protein